MKAAAIPSRWIVDEGCRLDAPPYLSGSFQARHKLEDLKIKKDRLDTLTVGHEGGIYNGPQFRRNYVNDRKYGVPFMTSSGMLLADLSQLPLLKRKDAESAKLTYLALKEGMTLISCSGSVGRTTYTRPDMEGVWSSQDIIKVVPDPEKILPGFLYAYLTSRFGQSLVTARTYGAIIPHLEPGHLVDLPVPRFGSRFEKRTHELVSKAAHLRADAAGAIRAVVESLPARLGLASLSVPSVSSFSTAIVQSGRLNMRFDAPYHSAAALETHRSLASGTYPVVPLISVLRRYFKPPMFKRLWVDSDEYGQQFISGSDAYRYQAESPRYVSRRTPNYDEFILHKGWVVFQAAGQIYGLFGKPLYVHGWLEDLFCADDIYRLVPESEQDGAYLFAFLKTLYGEVIIKRLACGNSIPRVWDPHIRDMLIPWPDKRVRQEIGAEIIAAHESVNRARTAENEAVRNVEEAIEEAT